MSEGKKVVLVVTEDLDRLLLQYQLKAHGFDVEVVVDQKAAGELITELLSSHTRREEVLGAIQQKAYSGELQKDSQTLMTNIAMEFNKFCVLHKFKALRDSTIGRLNYEFTQAMMGGFSAGLKEAMEEPSAPGSAFDKAKEVMASSLQEIMKELRNIRDAVLVRPEDKALRDFLNTPGLSVAGLVEGLRGYSVAISTTAPQASEPEKPTFGLDDWLDFAVKNPNKVKDHFTQFGRISYECRPVTSKTQVIDELTKVLTCEPGLDQLLPSVLLFSLPPEDRKEILKLLNPEFSVMTGGELGRGGRVTPEGIFETLLEAVASNEISTVTLHDLKHMDGGVKRNFHAALKAGLKKYGELIQTHKEASPKPGPLDYLGMVTGTEELGASDLPRGVFHTATSIIDNLIKAVNDGETNEITLGDLMRMDSVTKGDLSQALTIAAGKLVHIQQRRKSFMAHGEDVSPVSNKGLLLNTIASDWAHQASLQGLTVSPMRLLAYLLEEQLGPHSPEKVDVNNPGIVMSELAKQWVEAAAQRGVQVDFIPLLTHLMRELPNHTPNRFEKLNDLKVSSLLTHARILDGVTMGTHTFERNEDGSLKITNTNNPSFVILSNDGTVKLENPGYLGQ